MGSSAGEEPTCTHQDVGVQVNLVLFAKHSPNQAPSEKRSNGYSGVNSTTPCGGAGAQRGGEKGEIRLVFRFRHAELRRRGVFSCCGRAHNEPLRRSLKTTHYQYIPSAEQNWKHLETPCECGLKNGETNSPDLDFGEGNVSRSRQHLRVLGRGLDDAVQSLLEHEQLGRLGKGARVRKLLGGISRVQGDLDVHEDTSTLYYFCLFSGCRKKQNDQVAIDPSLPPPCVYARTGQDRIG